MNRSELLKEAVDLCMKEIYKYAVPKVSWEYFLEENKVYSKQCKEWEHYKKLKDSNPDLYKEYNERLGWEGKSLEECIGPAPYEFYYIPKDILEDIADSYISAYRMDQQQNLLDIIEILKKYCKEPIVDKYIDDYIDETGFHHSGYRSYDYIDNLEKEINTYLDLKFPLMDPERAEDAEDFENKLNTAAKELQDKFFKFLDMAGKFFNWNSEVNSFNTSIYLGASPNTNKEQVIKNWKQYRNEDIEINEEQIKKEYYGEEDFDE